MANLVVSISVIDICGRKKMFLGNPLDLLIIYVIYITMSCYDQGLDYHNRKAIHLKKLDWSLVMKLILMNHLKLLLRKKVMLRDQI